MLVGTGNHIKYSIRENGGEFVTQKLVANDADMPNINPSTRKGGKSSN